MKSHKLRRMSQKNIREMESLFKKLRTGKLEHNQSSIHCGTAHCVAGWVATLDAAKGLKIGDLPQMHFDEDKIVVSKLDLSPRTVVCDWTREQVLGRYDAFSGFGTEGDYTAQKWGLTIFEATRMFDSGMSLDQLDEMVLNFKAGMRFVRKYGSTWQTQWVPEASLVLYNYRGEVALTKTTAQKRV